MGMKIRESCSLSMFFTEFKLFRTSVPKSSETFYRSTAELMFFFYSDNTNI